MPHPRWQGKHDGTYVVLFLVDLVRGHVFGGGETRGGARVGVALCDLWGSVSALCRGKERQEGGI